MPPSVDWATTRVAGTPSPQPAVSASNVVQSQRKRRRDEPDMMHSSEKNQSLALTPVSDATAARDLMRRVVGLSQEV
jgi:hypothetical protein